MIILPVPSLGLTAPDWQHLCLAPLWDRERPWLSATRLVLLIVVLVVLRQMPPVCEVEIYL